MFLSRPVSPVFPSSPGFSSLSTSFWLQPRTANFKMIFSPIPLCRTSNTAVQAKQLRLFIVRISIKSEPCLRRHGWRSAFKPTKARRTVQSWVRTEHATILTPRWGRLHTLVFAGEIWNLPTVYARPQYTALTMGYRSTKEDGVNILFWLHQLRL